MERPLSGDALFIAPAPVDKEHTAMIGLHGTKSVTFEKRSGGSMQKKEPIISFHDFTFQYFSQKEPTLFNIDLEIRRGEKILIVGPSGSGKSGIS